jgi:hypothetical protein
MDDVAKVKIMNAIDDFPENGESGGFGKPAIVRKLMIELATRTVFHN